MEAPSNPGSKMEFAASQGAEPTSPDVSIEYSKALAQYRAALAAQQGITIDELHDQYRTGSAPEDASPQM